MKRYTLSKPAERDLDEIKDYIAEQGSPEAARKVLRNLKAAMHLLARNPGVGHLREDLTDHPVRFWPVYSYLIIYRTEIGPIEIVRVVHASRDIPTLL